MSTYPKPSCRRLLLSINIASWAPPFPRAKKCIFTSETSTVSAYVFPRPCFAALNHPGYSVPCTLYLVPCTNPEKTQTLAFHQYKSRKTQTLAFHQHGFREPTHYAGSATTFAAPPTTPRIFCALPTTLAWPEGCSSTPPTTLALVVGLFLRSPLRCPAYFRTCFPPR